MKLKDKNLMQKVLVAKNCWTTEAIPKLPQQESQSADVDVDGADLEISSFWLY